MKLDKITRESWILSAFPEWGNWLTEEIEAEFVDPGTVAMWWIGCTGIWLKSEAGCNLATDFWFGNGKKTFDPPEMGKYHQMRNMTGGRMNQPNRRAAPIVIDPFSIRNLDAVLSTHYHRDHICPVMTAAVLQNCADDVSFIGPLRSVKTWIEWGVPAERCMIVKPGDIVKIKDVEIVVLDSFDRTCLVTDEFDMAGICPDNMDEKAVNYLFKTSGGNIYHSGDSHYSIFYAKHGKDHKIDVALGSYGENPVGNQDKMTASDILRMAEATGCEVVIPIHYDVWTNFKADPKEIEMLWKYKKDQLEYKFHPYIWDVGGKYIYPADKDKMRYQYRRGFEDCFTDEPNLPFKAIL